MNSGGSSVQLCLAFPCLWQPGCRHWEHQVRLLWDFSKAFSELPHLLIRGELHQQPCAPGTFPCPLQPQVSVRWSRAQRAEICFAPLVKLLPLGLPAFFMVFHPSIRSRYSSEQTLGLLLTHIDYLLIFPTRLRKLINFRWTKADSKPAEICNKSLKWNIISHTIMTKCPLTSVDRPKFHFKYMHAKLQLMRKHIY